MHAKATSYGKLGSDEVVTDSADPVHVVSNKWLQGSKPSENKSLKIG